jgi:hypothetical protein
MRATAEVAAPPQRRDEPWPRTTVRVKDDKQYEGLRKKGISKERAAKIANTSNASSKGGKNSGGGGGNSSGGGTKEGQRKGGRKGGKKSS